MTSELIRTAEFVLPGHPDKLADAIADAIVQEAMLRERRALVGVEVAVHRDAVFIDGRVACAGAERIDFERLVRGVYGSA
ncbi:MAG: S-adenosylmethionine synthetase N-terminal domain-containing protein, partial [Planctomycetota bacterium]